MNGALADGAPDVDAGRLVRASATVALGTLLSRVTGLLRVGALAYAIGRASLADTYNLANTTPNIVYELVIGGVLTATLVPLFVEHLERGDERATSVVVTAVMTVLVALSALAVLAAPLLAQLYTFRAPAAERAAHEEVVTFFIRVFMPQMCFYGLTALATAVLHARRRFVAAAYAPVLNNVVVIATLVTFAQVTSGSPSEWTDVRRIRDDTGLLLLLGLGTTAGIVAMALVLVPAVRAAGVRLRVIFDWRHDALRRVARLSGWTAGYVIANQIALLTVLVLASGRSGGVSAYQYAFIFFQLPHGLFAVSIMTTITPELARHAAARDDAGMIRAFSLGLRHLLVVVVPAAVAFVVLAQPLVAVLVRGGFSAEDARVTADTLQAMSIGLVPFSIYLYTLRGFYALQDTRTPFVVNSVENGLNIALALALFPSFGVQGLALAYAAAYAIAAVLAALMLRRRLGGIDGARVAQTGVRTLAGGAALAMVAAPIAGAIGADTFTHAVTALGVAGALGGGAAVATMALLGTSELRAVAALLRRRTTPKASRV
ncbi:MAG TPA: murein biosynthesis integral membrane protein MurJ [Acidimicrobiia bacterium]|nr:murein biosynthesis integral membrane protein MurJ [Acidimicrobiia bacterium]